MVSLFLEIALSAVGRILWNVISPLAAGCPQFPRFEGPDAALESVPVGGVTHIHATVAAVS